MRRFARTISLALLGSLVPLVALAQQPQTSGAGDLEPSVKPDPLRFGSDEAFVAFSPFFQFEAGGASSSPDDLLDDVEHTDGQMRRARLYVDFGYYDFGGRFTADFAGDTAPDIIYAYLDYNFSQYGSVQVGQQEQQFSIQDLNGSRSAVFNENGANNALQPPGAVGAALFYGRENLSLGAGVYGTDINNEDPLGESVTVSGRATVAPVNRDDVAVHLGFGVSGNFDSDIPLSFSGSNGTSLFAVSPISTGDYEDVDSYLASNVEFAATAGRFTLQSEYTLARVDDGSRGDAVLHGGYLGILAFLTDDHRGYDGQYGIFERVKPKRPLNENSGDFGAVEIGARLDYLDLGEARSGAADDASGTQIAGTGILNWYLNDKIRLSASNTYTAVIEGPGDGNDYNTAIARLWFIY